MFSTTCFPRGLLLRTTAHLNEKLRQLIMRAKEREEIEPLYTKGGPQRFEFKSFYPTAHITVISKKQMDAFG